MMKMNSHISNRNNDCINKEEPEYLNLAHQFLDTNFIESTKCNSFNILPVISTNPIHESFVRPDPPLAVDYFSYNLTSKQYHSCWKNISNNQFMKPYELSNVDNITRLRTVQQTDDLMMFLPTTSQARLENACWRAWYKQLKNLNELNPSEINWFKENDVTVLYGPLIEEEEEGENKIVEEIKNNNESFNEIDMNWFNSPSSNLSSTDSSPVSSSYDSNSSDGESDLDSFILQRHFSSDSTRTSISSNSQTFNKTDLASNFESKNPENANTSTISKNNNNNNNSKCKELKSILKKRKNIYSLNRSNPKKRISFNQELTSVRFIV